MYLITIIIPIYNAEKYLHRTINSIMNQTIGFKNLELILVDDNSSDSSGRIIKEYSDKYPNIKSFFSDKNHGFPGYGRNVGIKNASADYIMFCDNDDEYELDFCETVFNVIENNECDIVSTNFSMLENSLVVYQNNFQKWDFDSELNEKMKLIKLDTFKPLVDVNIWTKIFKKSILWKNDINFIEMGFNEDSLFLYDYYFYADNLIFIDFYGYKHHRDGENLSYYSSKSTMGFIKSYYNVLRSVESKWGKVDRDELFKKPIQMTLVRIMLSSNQKCLLERLYKFERDINFNSPLNNFLFTFYNKLVLKRRFSLLIIIFKIMKQIKKFIDFLRNK